jgi:mitogen-activated protein kinase kinase kinase
VKTFVQHVVKGLVYLHAKNIIHRNIKGANILVDNKGTAKISDFHLSPVQGTAFCMAPEVVKQTAHTLKSDIWSVGCLVIEMCTGDHPWPSLTQMQAISEVRRPAYAPPRHADRRRAQIGSGTAKPATPSDISSEAAQFVDVVLDRDFEKRPTAAECLQHPWLAPPSENGSKIEPSPVES